MVALINQKKGYTDGQGLANSTLYTLAANSTTYASAFHDVTSGNNKCTSTREHFCTDGATTSFSAGTGYDQVTGLGSVDLAIWRRRGRRIRDTASRHDDDRYGGECGTQREHK